MKLASIYKRLFAFILDEICISFLFFVMFYDKLSSYVTYEEAMQGVASLVPYVVMIKIAYDTFFIWYYGASLGKMCFKLKVVASGAQNPKFVDAFVRASIKVISEMLFYIGFLFVFFGDMRQALHDKIAKTVVGEIG